MEIRTSVLGQGISWVLSTLTGGFALWIYAYGDLLTSKQWQYLMSVPGGKWSWITAFGVSALLTFIGILTGFHSISAIGMFFLGCSSLGIATFYVLAPRLDPGLLTAGWWPWLIVALAAYFLSAVFLRPIPWF